jgi:hypothetical protein
MQKDIQSLVENAVRQNFASASVSEVLVTEGRDHDDDPILEVVVSVGTQITKILPSELVSLTRHVRQALVDQDETRFPIIRVMTNQDWKKLKNEAA